MHSSSNKIERLVCIQAETKNPAPLKTSSAVDIHHVCIINKKLLFAFDPLCCPFFIKISFSVYDIPTHLVYNILFEIICNLRLQLKSDLLKEWILEIS